MTAVFMIVSLVLRKVRGEEWGSLSPRFTPPFVGFGYPLGSYLIIALGPFRTQPLTSRFYCIRICVEMAESGENIRILLFGLGA